MEKYRYRVRYAQFAEVAQYLEQEYEGAKSKPNSEVVLQLVKGVKRKAED